MADIMRDRVRKIHRHVDLLSSLSVAKKVSVEGILYKECGYKKGHTPPDVSEMTPFAPSDCWGMALDGHAWFRFHVTLPDDTPATWRPELRLSTAKEGWDSNNPQFICYINGRMRQGMDTFHPACILTEKENDVVLYAYTGMVKKELSLRAEVVFVDEEVEKLFFHIYVPYHALSCMETNSKDYMDTVMALDRTLLCLDLADMKSDAFHASVKEAIRYIEREYYGKICKKGPVKVVTIGHTHIDCAWLWTLEQTREKVQRTFSTVLEMMRRYPEYKFMSSQPLLYKKCKEEAPELYEEIKERVKEGRWEVEGSMWVEADCNLTSGESLVRQVVHGRRFFRQEFGIDTRVLWLPDVFGYSAALPQILKKAGVDWFYTSKISWNDENLMPYDIFRWRGIDGTAIPAYFLTCQDTDASHKMVTYTTYVAHTRPSMLLGTWNRMQQKNLTDEALLTFGWGDGGGGPSPEMVEILRRETHGLPGFPTATHEFAGDFLKRLEKKIDKNPDLPEWRGELYLEFHRGTYTSQAANKRNNRKSEFLFQNAEMLSEMTRVLLGCAYPAEELGEGWETILTNQFHDIIPGSSIREVYERCEKDYARVRALGEGAVSRATDAIVQAVDTEEEYLVFNPHSFPHSGPVKMGGETVFVENVPAKGYMAYTPKAAPCRVKIEGRRAETPHFRVVFDGEYRIASLYDKKAKRRVLSGKGNVLEVYEDIPYNYDAWELCSYYKEKKAELLDVASVCTVEDGCRKGLRITRRHMESLLVQTVWFYDSVPRIDFETEVDWKQEHQVLKVLFPVDANSDRATYEVQFGTVERPTHTNTSWDRMKFEVCAHKYADLSDNGYGVSMLNDCKYGHDIHGNEMRLTLLKCATHPDPMADKCHHTFTYSIYPHAGALKDGDTLRQAYDLNLPMTAVKAKRGTGRLPERFSLLSVKAQGVIAETVKKAYDSEDTVVRMYEAKNMTEKAVLTFGFPVAEVWECDLEENPIRALPVKNGTVRLELKPFEILTLKAVSPKEEA